MLKEWAQFWATQSKKKEPIWKRKEAKIKERKKLREVKEAILWISHWHTKQSMEQSGL